MDEKEIEVPTMWVLGFVVTFGLSFSYVEYRLRRRKNIKKIEAWQADRIACIDGARQRLEDMAKAGCTFDEYMDAYRMEFAFLDQIIGPKPF